MAPVPGLESAQSYPFNNTGWPDSDPPPCHFDRADVLPHSVFTNSTSITHKQSSGDSYGQLEAMVHFNGPLQIGINAGVFKWKHPHGQVCPFKFTDTMEFTHGARIWLCMFMSGRCTCDLG